ncbi:MAG: hypothetical protein E4H37_04905 [Gemmatimonadales bacterium]|jgi:heme/copper-type cytochrome/quinol oxidase subunit 1|nr:MAG: hypothetical protein E4H37_04905 [Gemmatimonadales bacterium]
MHTTVRRYIKTGVAFLAAGLLSGLYMVVRREVTGRWPSPYLVAAHTHVLLVGFMMFMILGVALWIFPRPERDDTRYRPGLVDLAYWLLLGGTAGRFLGEVARVSVEAVVLRWVVVIASLAQVAGILLFMWTIWSRIRAVGSKVREARGERF